MNERMNVVFVRFGAEIFIVEFAFSNFSFCTPQIKSKLPRRRVPQRHAHSTQIRSKQDCARQA